MGDLQVKSGINENVSFVSNGGYINFLNSYVGGWDLQPAGPTRIVNSDLDSLDLEVSDSWTGLIILTPGYVEYRELDWNFEPVVIENSSIANYAIAVMSNNNLEIVNSGFAQILGQSCNMTIRNSNVSQLCCIRSGMFMIVNSTIDNCCLIQLRHCSLNLTLTEGFHDYFNILAEEISLNLTLLNSNVKTWRVSASTGVQLELHDSELSAWSFALGGNVVKADVLSLGGDAHCGFFNSTIERVRCTGSADLTLENCKVEILYIYGSANVTAINSVIKTVITDPSSVKLNNSLVILSMDFAFQFTGDDGVSVLYSKDATIPLPANAEAFSSYANVTTSQGESFSAQVKMYYNETEVLTAGIKENRLRIYFLADQGVWETCPVQGVDSDENYVWANVTSLSTFVVVYGGPVHDLAVLDLKSEKTVFAEDQIATVNVTVANNGDFAESFNVTSLVNGTVVDLQSLTVQSSDLASFTFELNTTAVLKGHYTLIAQVSPVENETNVGNNALSLSVTITIPGDVNGDMTVDIYDAIVLAGAYNSHAGSPNWNPNADINCDSTVDIYDAIILANHYNQHYP
jgi:hypothetical protein